MATTRAAHRDEPHFLLADDGVPITLVRVRGAEEPSKGPVLLVHGLANRSESFRPPVSRSIVDALIDDGWDVWMLNWRGSIDLDPLPWTLDDVAVNDHPAAVRYVAEATGSDTVKVVAHCVGAMTMSMSIVGGLLPQVDVIVANGVSLHPVLPRGGRVKLRTIRAVMQHRQPFVDVAWGDGPERGVARLTRTSVRLWHVECRNPACNMASFALGSGHPALFRHDNLDDATHDWLGGEFGKVPMSFYTQMAASDRRKEVVSLPGQGREGFSPRWASAAPRSETRFALLAGAHNRAFLPESQRASFDYLERHQPGRHSLRVLPRYGHSDVFFGKRAHNEVFPLIVAELNR